VYAVQSRLLRRQQQALRVLKMRGGVVFGGGRVRVMPAMCFRNVVGERESRLPPVPGKLELARGVGVAGELLVQRRGLGHRRRAMRPVRSREL